MRFVRNIRKRLEEALSTSPAVLIEGARQVGKTTLVDEFVKGRGYHSVTFDVLTVLSAAQKDPQGFIESLPKPVLIDEVQRVPEILLPIKRDIDLNRVPGRYILTGSAHPLHIKRVGESLAGRLETLALFPLSQGECRGIKEDFITAVFKESTFLSPKEQLSKEQLYKLITKGGYPIVQDMVDSRSQAWFRSYVNDILLNDVRDLVNIERLIDLPDLLKLVAYRAGHVLNVSDLSRIMGMSASTVQRYLALLEAIHVLYMCRPWRASAEKRLVKSPKPYIVDTGLLASLQGITAERMLAEPTFTGHILENFVWAELVKQSTWTDTFVNIYHFRTSSGEEVDIVLEDSMGRVVGIEMKNTDTLRSHDFKGLSYLQQLLGDKFVRGIVLYTGDAAVPFGKKLWALPYSSLWQY